MLSPRSPGDGNGEDLCRWVKIGREDVHMKRKEKKNREKQQYKTNMQRGMASQGPNG